MIYNLSTPNLIYNIVYDMEHDVIYNITSISYTIYNIVYDMEHDVIYNIINKIFLI